MSNGLAKKRSLSNERFKFTNRCQGYVFLAIVGKSFNLTDMQKIIYNNNHKWQRTYGPGGKRKGHIIERDYSYRVAIVCDRCEKEINEWAYTVEVTDDCIRYMVDGAVTEKPLSKDPKEKAVEILMATGGKIFQHFCHTCNGRTKDFLAELRHRAKSHH